MGVDRRGIGEAIGVYPSEGNEWRRLDVSSGLPRGACYLPTMKTNEADPGAVQGRSSLPPFRRWLTPKALQRVMPLAAALAECHRQPLASVELRQNDRVYVYYRGYAAMLLQGSAGGHLVGQPFRAEEALLRDGKDLLTRVALARRDIDAYVKEWGELDAQAAAVSALAGSREFVVVDQQVRLPSKAVDPSVGLSDHDIRTALATQPDLLLADTSGRLWSVEVKLGDSEDLDGPVLAELGRAPLLPRVLRGGMDAFAAHYAEVLRQKQALRLTDWDRSITGPLALAILVLDVPQKKRPGPGTAPGQADELRRRADGRIACWEPAGIPAGTMAAIVEPDRAFGPGDFALAEDLHRAALADLERAPYAPRRSRWNSFTDAEGPRQEKVLELVRTGAAQPRATWEQQFPHFGAELDGYLKAHHIDAHHEVLHPLSSQAACLQLFAPAIWGPEWACDALTSYLDVAARDAGFRVVAVRDIDFEAPHGQCIDSPCPCAASMRDLVHETGHPTQLDVLVRVDAERNGVATPALIGIEVKYTEPEFGTCGGFRSRGWKNEEWRRACIQGGRDRVDHCYLKVNEGRKYLVNHDIFREDPLAAPGPCLLLGPANQVHRGFSAVRALAEKAGNIPSMYLVVHHQGNPSLHLPERTIPGCAPFTAGAYDRYRQALRPDLRGAVNDRTFAQLLDVYTAAAGKAGPEWLGWLRSRYGVAGSLGK